MKKSLITLLLAATTLVPMAAQNDTTNVDAGQPDEIEVFSDTTQGSSVPSIDFNFDDMDDDNDPDFGDDSFQIHSVFDGLDTNGITGMFFVLAVLLIIFVLSPIVILGLILWFVYKNRKNRMRLAEMAMKNGQPIPEDLVKEVQTSDVGLREKGVRQIFLGIGLIFLLGWAAGKIGAGIGVLVLCLGLGNVLIARSAKEKQEQNFTDNKFDRNLQNF